MLSVYLLLSCLQNGYDVCKDPLHVMQHSCSGNTSVHQDGIPACESIPRLTPLLPLLLCSCVELQQLNAQHQQLQQMCELAEQEIFKELCQKVGA